MATRVSPFHQTAQVLERGLRPAILWPIAVVEYLSSPRGPLDRRMSQPSGSALPSTPIPNQVSATRIFLRGLAISLPPILTLLILFWIVHGINDFVVQPISSAVRFCIAHAVNDARPLEGLVAPDGLPALPFCERNYRILPIHRTELLGRLAKADESSREVATAEVRIQLEDLAFVPFDKQALPYLDYRDVVKRLGPVQMPKTSIGVYMELAATRYFQSLFHLSAVAVVISIVTVYSIGRLVTHRLGAWFVMRVGSFVTGVPLVGAIYIAVKHVTDFFLAEKDPKFRRVVAVEYPRPGIWSLAFVTGTGMSECVRAAGEPLVNVLIPSAPIPFAGYTMNVKRSELLDLDMSLDQAIQYVMSCGVIVPTPTSPPMNAKNGINEPPALPGQSTQPAF